MTRYELVVYLEQKLYRFTFQQFNALTWREPEWIEIARKLGRPIPEPRGKLAYA